MIDATNLHRALKNLAKVDGTSNSWDLNGACADVIEEIDKYIDARIKALQGSAAPEKIPSARDSNNQ